MALITYLVLRWPVAASITFQWLYFAGSIILHVIELVVGVQVSGSSGPMSEPWPVLGPDTLLPQMGGSLHLGV